MIKLRIKGKKNIVSTFQKNIIILFSIICFKKDIFFSCLQLMQDYLINTKSW